MTKYTAIFTSKTRSEVVVRFTTFGKQQALAAAQRFARDNVLHLDTVKEAA